MLRSLILAAGLGFIITQTQAQDAIPADTVVAVKKATVFVRVQAGPLKGSGSGFVVSADKDSVLIATNYHVIAGAEFDKKRLSPAEFAKNLKSPTITVVFDGGTTTELSAPAEAIAADPDADLAILRVTGLKAPPKPIDYAALPKLSETMSVYTFGYPFGQALATGKGAPAITVGKGSVSSLRNDDNGELSVVQIDGSLNPGNSGGPVVDTKGQLVGVAVATIKNGQGIGFAVPAAELGKVLKGRLGGFQMTATKAADGKLTIKAEVGVIDPVAALRGVTLHYVVVDAKAKKPDSKEAIEKQTGAKKALLKIESGVASGEVILDAIEGELFVQAVPDGGLGAAGVSTVRSFGLVAPKGASGAVVLGAPGAVPGGSGAGDVPAPAGWKEYTATNKTYKVWIPEKANTSEKQRTSGKFPAQRVNFNSVVADMPGGATYIVEQLILIPPPRMINREEVMKLLRDVSVGEGVGAKVVRENDTKMGKFNGTEFLIERGGSATRARGFVIGSSIYLLRAIGTRDQVDSTESMLFLDSCRLQVITHQSGNSGSVIAGSGGDPEFKEMVPAGGTLVGLEIGLGKHGTKDVVKAMRPIYLVGDKESTGEWQGPTSAEIVKETKKVIAKPGYAIGGLSVRFGPALYGVSITFMKLADGKLDPKDSYDSEWIGTEFGAGPTKIGGTGELALGFIGKKNANATMGVGLLYKEVAVQIPPPPVNRGPRIQGGGNTENRDLAPEGGLLVGVEVALGKFGPNDTIAAVRPIFRVGDKETQGEQYGTNNARIVKVVAKPGYAVGSMTVKTGLGMDGLSLTFMKVLDGKLDPKDSYESDWLGGKGGGGPVRMGGDGTQVIGLLVRTNPKDVSGLGLAYLGEKPWPAGKPDKILGGGDVEFRVGGPAGSLLVGLEVGLGKSFNNDVVRAVRPIYRVGDKDTVGDPVGVEFGQVVKVVAKPGYAIGALSAKGGLYADGLSVTFMKVLDGKLDPKDAYESEWVGSKGGAGPTTSGGSGTLVVGVIGRMRNKDIAAWGLLLKDEPKK
ncbi:MAG: serine protease [Planctomycetes bacterium]|nr:serine protease [Planctomycetota bacterium]